jgi:hypothetical protein
LSPITEDLFQQDRADLLFVDQDVGILKCDFHAIGIRDEVTGEVAAVQLHAFDDFELGERRVIYRWIKSGALKRSTKTADSRAWKKLHDFLSHL